MVRNFMARYAENVYQKWSVVSDCHGNGFLRYQTLSFFGTKLCKIDWMDYDEISPSLKLPIIKE